MAALNISLNDLIKMALIEGEQSGESSLSIQDIIQSEKEHADK